jgi:glycosyltransferase involved in cell wall biosynthesis
MIEAMACGTPVIAWNNGSVPEVIDHGVTGFVVETVEEASMAVDKAISLDRRRIRSAFDERFTVGRMARDYVHLYRNLVRPVAVSAVTAALHAAE